MVLAAVAALTLLATAAFHATGYSLFADSIAASSAPPFVKDVAPGLWLFFSWHLTAVALGIFFAAIALGSAARPVLYACAVVVLVDFSWVLATAGLFAGTALLFLAAVCTLAAAYLSAARSGR